MSTILVRLKPYNRKLGHVLRTFTIWSMRFKEKNGWYEVEQEIANGLKEIRQPPVGDRPPSMMPLAFDIMTQKAAIAYEEEQRKLKEARAKALSPHKINVTKLAPSKKAGDLVTSDLGKNQKLDEPMSPAPKARKSTRGRSTK